MARMKFLCDTKRCIECNGSGENSISVACMHCTDAPCMAVCPADCFEHTEDGIVLHNKDLLPVCLPIWRASVPETSLIWRAWQNGQMHLDAEKISDIFRQRVVERGAKEAGWTNGEDLSYDATRS